MSSRNYKSGVKEALIAWCQGTCYWPDCIRPVVVMIEGEPVLDVEVAHIHAKELNGPRYDPNVDADAFGNLILLCGPHHKIIDKKNPEAYPPDLLRAWKRQREAGGAVNLQGLRSLDDDLLQQIIDRTFQPAFDKISDALDRMEQYDAEAAQMLRQILGELEGFKRHNLGLNEDLIASLDSASHRLYRTLDEGVVSDLRVSAETLRNLPQLAEQLHAAADALRSAQQYY